MRFELPLMSTPEECLRGWHEMVSSVFSLEDSALVASDPECAQELRAGAAFLCDVGIELAHQLKETGECLRKSPN